MPDESLQPAGGSLAFILSAPRAGSTLLAAILGSHSQILCPPEPWFLLPLVKMQQGQMFVASAYDHQMASQAMSDLTDSSIQNVAIRAYAEATYAALLRGANKRVFVDKTPRYYQIAGHLTELFPEAVQIWLKRNPLDVIASLKSTWGLAIPELLGSQLSPYTFDAVLSHTLLAEHFAASTGVKREVKYEDLAAHPEANVRAICRLLDLPFEPPMLEYGANKSLVESYGRAHMGDKNVLAEAAAHTHSVNRWATVLEPAEVRACLLSLGSRSFSSTGYADTLLQACEVAGLMPDDLSAEGDVPTIREAYTTYASDAQPAGATQRGGAIQYTLLGQRSAVLQKEAEERLEVIHRLDAEVRVLQERASLAEVLKNIEAAMTDQAASIAHVQASLAGRLDAPVDVVRAREDAEAVAEARLLVIQEQERALTRYRRLHPREILSQWTAPRIGQLYQYPPRPLHIPSGYSRTPTLSSPPTVSIVTTSLNQGRFIERTLRSVLDQGYPGLEYIVQDAASSDGTREILGRYKDRLAHVASESDSGFANGINRGFQHATGELMAYLNSDDILLPGALHYIASYFSKHPEVDVVYGHRVIIDEYDAEIGRWVLPPHDDEVLSWADYVPQETLFWRRTSWDKIGGLLDESFRFAIDWDLLIRLRESGATMHRLPRFLGAFRVHPHQKTSSQMADVGVHEMDMLRERCHGRHVHPTEISNALREYLRQHFIYHKLYRLGVLRY